jgi:hypothetical protein
MKYVHALALLVLLLMYFATHAQCKSIALPDLCTLLLVKEVVVHNFFSSLDVYL